MKSGLDGRNNPLPQRRFVPLMGVSMKSGLDGRNNKDTDDKSKIPG